MTIQPDSASKNLDLVQTIDSENIPVVRIQPSEKYEPANLVENEPENLEDSPDLESPGKTRVFKVFNDQSLTPKQMLRSQVVEPSAPLNTIDPILDETEQSEMISPDPKAQAIKLEPKSFKDIRKSMVLTAPQNNKKILTKSRSFGILNKSVQKHNFKQDVINVTSQRQLLKNRF